jgi:hypothetical protein
MKTEMTRMNTCPQFYFHIELPAKLDWSYPISACIYGLHPLLPIEYLLPSKLGENIDPQPIRVLTR